MGLLCPGTASSTLNTKGHHSVLMGLLCPGTPSSTLNAKGQSLWLLPCDDSLCIVLSPAVRDLGEYLPFLPLWTYYPDTGMNTH